MWSFTVKVLVVITLLQALWFFQINGLKCRKDNSGQEAHFKRVIRSCMRKMAEMGNNRNENNNNSNNNRHNFGRNFNMSDNNNSNNNRNRYNQRESYFNPSDEHNKYGGGNNNDEYGNKYTGNRYSLANRYNQQQQQQQQQRQGDYDSYSGWNADEDEGNQRRGQNGVNGVFNGSACVVHCFFSDLNMVNENGYPDRNQINYLLAQGTRDRELKAFYSDTLQKCFHFVDSKQHRDRCFYSRDIAQCLMEYANANCEDLQSHSIMFN